MALMSGISREIIAPWVRVGLDASVPVADAIRERCLVWISGQEEMALRYPKAALALPYSFAVVAAPIEAGMSAWGGLVLLWPGSRPRQLAPGTREEVQAWCRRLGFLLQREADREHPVLPGPEPRMVSWSSDSVPGPAVGWAAVDYTERLPEGCCGLDSAGRVTYVSSVAAALLGVERSSLVGAKLSDALPWLDASAFQDQYRAAVVGGQPTSFAVLDPLDRQLVFHLYPDVSGVSIRIMSASDSEDEGSYPLAPATPNPTAGVQHLLHLAATLTEAVGVQDVVDQAADQLLDAFNAQGLILFVEAHGRLRIIGHRGYDAEVLSRFDGTALTGAPTPSALALTAGVPSFFDSRDEMEWAYPDIARVTMKSAWAFLPLIASGRPVGCWTLSYDQPHRFTPEERAILTSTAGLLAQALDRATLYDNEHHLV
ncbi:GAF domain-containing protein, partial [Streptomyces sp. NPDC001185]|uniref:GAF domain-containing protein n=1 Tax=Streptomyces sp. NPDC001185 TaxID=3154380 RepID=UPI00332882CD